MDDLHIPTSALTLILMIFISLSAFFSASETALTGSNKLRLKNLPKAATGKPGEPCGCWTISMMPCPPS